MKKKNRPYWRLVYKINKGLVNLLYPLDHKKMRGVDPDSPVIVSLTTYPARIGQVRLAVSSLLRQTMKPRKVILWLAEEQFTQGGIPESLRKLESQGLEIRSCEDLKPHKKYYYAVQEYPDCWIVTADDDIFYPEDHIERLWRAHDKYQDAVVCRWSHRIGFDAKGGFVPYNDWADNGEEPPAYATLAVGCNGILYPPGSLPKETFDPAVIAETALYTDDLWLKCMEIRNGRRAVNCDEIPLIYFNILSTRKSGLWKDNIGESAENDKVWGRLMERYPDVWERLKEEYEHDRNRV